MSSKAITEKKETTLAAPRWHVAREVAPSVMAADRPMLPRIIGVIGLFLVIVGGVPLAARLAGDRPFFRPLSEIIPTGWSAFFCIAGLGCLLFHAACDPDLQIRRAYMAKGLAWLLLGAILSVWPVHNSDGALVFGTKFLPFGVLGFVLGVLFLTAFVRNESELKVKDGITYLIGGLGGAMAVGGLLFGSIFANFLLPAGAVLSLLGLFFLWAFIGLRSVDDPLASRAALGMGVVGGLVFLVAFTRSVLLPLMVSLGWVDHVPAYAIPHGLVLCLLGLFYGAVSIGLLSDHSLIVLTRRELGSLFFSPIAYTVLLGFTTIGWGLFLQFLLTYLWISDPPRGQSHAILMDEPVVGFYFISFLPIISAIFVVPVLTMRTLSEEQRSGTLEMLLTAPVNETAIVLSKFIAAFVFYLIVWLPWALYLVALWSESGNPFDYLPVLAFFIALAASGAGFIAMGVFCSSVTRNQLAAAILTFVGMIALTLFYFVPSWFPGGETLTTVCQHVSYIDLWINAVKGKLTSRDLVFHISAAVFWLFLTVKVLDVRKWW